MEIVRAKPEHAATLSALAMEGFTETFGHLYSAENLQKHLAKSCSEAFFAKAIAAGDVILLAFVDGKPAGYTKAGKLELGIAGAEADALELHRLYVLSPFQGKAVGKALMEAVLNMPPLCEASELYLGVWEENYKAQAFYARYGFAPHSEYTYYVGDHADRELVLKREQR